MRNGLFESITYIIFDLDGLLIDSEPLWQMTEEKVLARYGKNWDESIAHQHIGLRLDAAAAVMVKAYDLQMDYRDLETEILADMFQLIAERLTLMPGANALIQSAHDKGFVLGIASSSREDYIQAVVDQCGWSPYIQAIASGYNVSSGKPAPDVYLQAAQFLQIDPTKGLALEDSVNGSKAAFAAGLRTVAIPGHGFTPADFAGFSHVVLPSLHEVISHLKP